VLGDYTAQLCFNYGGHSALIEERSFSVGSEQEDSGGRQSSFSTLEVIPETIEIELSPGALRTSKFSLLNRLPETVNLNLEFESEISEWLRFIKPALVIPSGKERDVVFRIAVPNNVQRENYGGTIVVRDKANDIEKRIAVNILIRE
jgi:hypothetical protein